MMGDQATNIASNTTQIDRLKNETNKLVSAIFQRAFQSHLCPQTLAIHWDAARLEKRTKFENRTHCFLQMYRSMTTLRSLFNFETNLTALVLSRLSL